MALTEPDRELLQQCLQHQPEAWETFVRRFLGVIYHAIRHTALVRGIQLGPPENEDLAGEVLLELVRDDLRALRHFRQSASLATYVAVIARRVAARKLASRRPNVRPLDMTAETVDARDTAGVRLENREHVARLLDSLPARDAQLVRSYYLEQKSYQQISRDMGIPENSIGPTLARLRSRLRKTEE